MRQAEARAQARLRVVMEAVAARRLSDIRLDPNCQYLEGIGYVIGDITCRFNAHSSYIRCAVNPLGPCEDCSHYQSRNLPN
jgi:Family of unknown function (DUF6464)